jgi:glycosyltransferase involved in cell wall biosynthesis
MARRLKAHELGRFKIHHVPNGLDCEQFKPVPDARAVAKLPQGVPIILHVAQSRAWSMTERKGLRFLADAFITHVLPAYPNALLVVVGEGAVPNHRSVFPAGPATQEELPAYYSSSDVFVAPTLADNLPYTVMEAMACGVPVVGSAVGGVPEQIEDGVTGILVPKAEPAPLGAALVRLLQDRETLKRMGMAGRRRVLEQFDMSQFAQKYEEIFLRAASRRN